MSLKTHLKIAHFSRSNISFRDFGVIKIVAVKFIQVTFQSKKKISHTWRLALHFVFLILRPRHLEKEINIFSFQHIFQSSAFYKNSYNQLFRIYLIILTADIFSFMNGKAVNGYLEFWEIFMILIAQIFRTRNSEKPNLELFAE